MFFGFWKTFAEFLYIFILLCAHRNTFPLIHKIPIENVEMLKEWNELKHIFVVVAVMKRRWKGNLARRDKKKTQNIVENKIKTKSHTNFNGEYKREVKIVNVNICLKAFNENALI